MLDKAIQIATEAHKGQLDKGGHDYIGHPLRVMDSVSTENEKMVAVLHDVVEDTDITVQYLINEKFNIDVILGVQAMTRGETESYNVYIGRVMQNKIALRVKIADLRDNLDLTRLNSLKDVDTMSLNMYIKTYNKLIKYEREHR